MADCSALTLKRRLVYIEKYVVCVGRWWVVGSAWTGRDTRTSQSEGASSSSAATLGEGSEAWLLGVARQQHMNTDLRKTLFGVMMTSEV